MVEKPVLWTRSVHHVSIRKAYLRLVKFYRLLTLALLPVRVQLVPDVARALVPAERVDARVAAAVVDGRALVKFLHERG